MFLSYRARLFVTFFYEGDKETKTVSKNRLAAADNF